MDLKEAWVILRLHAPHQGVRILFIHVFQLIGILLMVDVIRKSLNIGLINIAYSVSEVISNESSGFVEKPAS